MEATSNESQKFAEELAWCITQLELGLMRQSPDSKQATEAVKVLKILKSSKAPMVKKRQAMRNALGDYRKKMKDAEKKTLAGLRHSQFKAIDITKLCKKSKFLKQSHSKQLHPANSQLPSTLTNLNINNSQTSTSAETGDLACGPSCSKSLDSEDMFKYVPSDNSFYFGFEPESADEELEASAAGKSKDENIFSLNSKKSSNSFEFQGSSNEFQFNFETTECGS